MSLTKDGFYKSFSGAIGNNNYLLEARGGHIGWGNSANQIPYSNGAINTNLNADMIDGYHKTDLIGELTKGSWNPRGTNLAMDWYYNGGDMSISESGGQISVSVDGYFYQNEGQYKVLDENNYPNYTDSRYVLKTGDTMVGTPYINMPASAASISNNQPFGITYGRIQGYGDIFINADTDGSTSEYVHITAGYGAGTSGVSYGLAIGYNNLYWKGGILFANTSNVGIGTTNPQTKLHVEGNELVSGTSLMAYSIKILPSVYSELKTSYGLSSDYESRYNTEEFLQSWVKYAYANGAGYTVQSYISPNSRGFIIADVYASGINSSTGYPEHITGRYYPHGGSEIIFGTSYGSWYYRTGYDDSYHPNADYIYVEATSTGDWMYPNFTYYGNTYRREYVYTKLRFQPSTGHLLINGAFDNCPTKYDDGNDRPGISITGSYPQLSLISNVSNSSHGPVLSIGAYDSAGANSGGFKTFRLGTKGYDATWLDLSYGTHANVHDGIDGWNPSGNGLQITRFHNNRTIYNYGTVYFGVASYGATYYHSGYTVYSYDKISHYSYTYNKAVIGGSTISDHTLDVYGYSMIIGNGGSESHIYARTSNFSNPALSFYDDTSGYGIMTVLGGGGCTVVGGGESAHEFAPNVRDENLYLTADQNVNIFTNLDGGYGSRRHVAHFNTNGDTYLYGNLYLGANASNNFIAFYGNTGDAPGSYVTTFIGEHLWGGSESTELLFMKFNDVGNGTDGTTAYSSGPDRIRHLAHAHVFQIMTDTSQNDFVTMANSSAVETKFDIARYQLHAYAPLAIISDSTNSGYDGLVYMRHYSNNDWGLIVDKSQSYTYGVDIRAGGEYALKVGNGNTRLIGATIIGADATPSYTLDVRGHIRATENLLVSTNNTTGGGIIFADDGDIVDLNDAYCSMRFSYGVRIYSANRGGSWMHELNANGKLSNYGVIHRSYNSYDYLLTSNGDARHINSLPYYYQKGQWIDMTGYSESYWHPVVLSSLPYEGYRKIKVTVQLNSGSTPSWSTHPSGFTCNMEIYATASGWGTTASETICTNYTYQFANDNPCGYMQLSWPSLPILMLRGGGKYYVITDWDASYTIYDQTYTWTSGSYSQGTGGPYTSCPGINFNKNWIYAHTRGNIITDDWLSIRDYSGNYHGRSNNISGLAGEIWFGGNFHIDSQNGQHLYLNYYSEYNTYINPRGGNVGIGNDSPSQKLHISGNQYITGYINLNDHGYLMSGRSTSFNYGYSLSLGDSSNSMGMFSGPGGEEGAVIVSPDTCVIYNSFDQGWGFQVFDKDRGGDLTTDNSRVFGINQANYFAWSRGGFWKEGSSDSYVLLGGGGHKALSDFSMSGHNHDGRYLQYEGWWNSGSGQNVDDSHGMNFTYTDHGAPRHWGTTVTFECDRGSAYRLQLHGTGDNYLYFRNRSADYGGWHSSGWKQILTDKDTYVSGSWGWINGTRIDWTEGSDRTAHLLINGSTWWSNWYWSGQSGQPAWLWGSNDGTNMYIWNPSNFSVNYANYAGYAHKLDIYGYSSDGLSFYQTSSAFDESDAYFNSWAHYIIANHGDGASYYHYTIALPFWSWPRYKRQTGSVSSHTQWYSFVTEENIGNYYWANLSVQKSSNAYTVPSFAAIKIRNSSPSYHSANNIISGTAGEIYFAGNFHIDSRGSNATYINHYTGNNVYMVTGGGSVGIGTASPSYKLHVTGDVYANGGWLRSSGAAGWYAESYGGGWWMTDSTWLRNYNNKPLFMYTSTGNSDATPIARFVKNWDCGNMGQWDTVTVSSNDCTSIRIVESDGTCTGIAAGDSYSTFTSAGSNGMRFFVHGSNSSSIWSGMGGDELLWLKNGNVGITKGLQLSKYVTSSNYANFYGWSYVPSLVCYSGSGSGGSFIGFPFPDEAHFGQIVFIGGTYNSYDFFMWGVPNGTGTLSSQSSYRSGNYCISEQGEIGNCLWTSENDDSRFFICVRYPNSKTGYVWRLYACCWNN